MTWNPIGEVTSSYTYIQTKVWAKGGQGQLVSRVAILASTKFALADIRDCHPYTRVLVSNNFVFSNHYQNYLMYLNNICLNKML